MEGREGKERRGKNTAHNPSPHYKTPSLTIIKTVTCDKRTDGEMTDDDTVLA